MSVDQIFHVILFFLPRRSKIQNGREKMTTRFNKIYYQQYDPAQSVFQFKRYIPEIELLNGDTQCELPI